MSFALHGGFGNPMTSSEFSARKCSSSVNASQRRVPCTCVYSRFVCIFGGREACTAWRVIPSALMGVRVRSVVGNVRTTHMHTTIRQACVSTAVFHLSLSLTVSLPPPFLPSPSISPPFFLPLPPSLPPFSLSHLSPCVSWLMVYCRGFGFVTFSKAETVDKVLEAHSEDPIYIDDKLVRS